MTDDNPERQGRQADLLQLIPAAASALGIGVSCLVLTGWAMNLSALRSVVPGQPQMVPNTAITFILASVSVWMLWREKCSQSAYRLARICSVAVVLMWLLSL